MSGNIPQQWGSVNDVAELLGVSTRTVRRMIERGDLPAKRISARLIRIPLEAISPQLLGQPIGGEGR